MAEALDIPVSDDGRLAENITHFARALRRAGLPVGSGRVVDAIRAVEVAGFTRKQDFYTTLEACFCARPEHRVIFAQIFRLYWRDPQFLQHMMSMLMPAVRGAQEEVKASAAERRAAEALLDQAEAPAQENDESQDEEVEFDATMTFSASERLKRIDFEQMTNAEAAQARRAIAQLDLPVKPIASRRAAPAARGQLADWRATMRAAMRSGGEIRQLKRRARKERLPNLIALCDISGSMSSYSRMLLHFLHAAANAKGAGWAQVHSFTFGTRLTNITRHMRARDVDAALAAAGAEAQDWEGGTRIGACLHEFNRDWSRRVMGQGAVVLLITDGLDRDDPDVLAAEMERLRLSSRRLIWLNPLLRWDGFTPRARGVRAMLPHVDAFCAGHSIATLEDLAQTLSRADTVGEKSRLMAAMRD